ncbi:MAG TPA: TonB-dependent receptor plug domain-containing protein [Gemmatimonadaceae bacterium]|nr:TonB-dependent receptor plug domain-containing protein [Gemmatimonadaceae bacterium]
MLTVEVDAASGKKEMKLAHLTFAFAIVSITAACAAERAVSPQAPASSAATTVGASMMQVPLLYVVDGVRLQRDQLPSLTNDQISAVEVIKGRAALKQYGPDASYGVVVITTKAAAAPRS